MTDEEWRQGVLRRLDHLEQSYKEIQKRLNIAEKQSAIDEVLMETIDKRLGSIEDILKWLVRIIIGCLILGMIAFVISGGMYVP